MHCLLIVDHAIGPEYNLNQDRQNHHQYLGNSCRRGALRGSSES